MKIKPEEGVKYQIQIIAWLKGEDQPTVMETVDGESTTYSLNGNELFLRTKIISDKAKENPFMPGDVEVAWTQPVKTLLK